MTDRMYKGQGYRVVGSFERERKDGSIATILLWQSECLTCGEAFTFSLPELAAKFSPNRRCWKHKRPGQRGGTVRS